MSAREFDDLDGDGGGDGSGARRGYISDPGSDTRRYAKSQHLHRGYLRGTRPQEPLGQFICQNSLIIRFNHSRFRNIISNE